MHHLFLTFYIVLLLFTTGQGISLSSVDFQQSVIDTEVSPHQNVIGLSMYLPQWLPLLNNSLFKGYIANSALFNNYANLFQQSIHTPIGYKYNCSSALYVNSSINCTDDLANNLSIIVSMQNYFSSLCHSHGIILGWDMERQNFNNTAYLDNFLEFITLFYRNNISIELLDYGNQLTSLARTNYTINDYIQDLDIIKSYFRDGLRIVGPGITEDADSSWVDQLDYISNNYRTIFTFRCILFKNISEATIDNLMNDSYSKEYLLKRIAYSNGDPIDMTHSKIGINQIRLTNDSGLDQVTNSFAAALWALDIAVQFSSMGGNFINFYNPLSFSNQSIIGSTSTSAPGAIYYGLLFAIYALQGSPIFEFPFIQPGYSKDIKIFGFRLRVGYKILIINKDIRPNITGTVQIVMGYTKGLQCVYLSANNLSSTSGITIGGISYISNSSRYVGNFTVYNYYMDNNTGLYSVNISSAQAAVCNTILQRSDYYFPRYQNANICLYYSFILVIIGMLITI